MQSKTYNSALYAKGFPVDEDVSCFSSGGFNNISESLS